MNAKRAIRIESCAIFFIGLLIFTISPHAEFLSLEARFAIFAKTMMQHGISLFPATYLGPYADYPSTIVVLTDLVSSIFGRVTPLTVIFPTAAISAATLVVIYRIGLLHRRIWGLYAVLFALFTQQFFISARSVSPDQFVSFFTALSFYIVYSATLLQTNKRLLWLPILFIASFLFRGPIGIVIPVAVSFIYAVLANEKKKAFLIAIVGVLLFIICGALLLWLANHEYGYAFARQIFLSQAFGRMNNGAKNVPFYYYWIHSFGSYAVGYPLALLVIATCVRSIFKRVDIDHRFLLYLIAWVFIILLGMSIPGAKKSHYVLPIVPALSLISAYLFVDLQKQGALFWLRKGVVLFCSAFPWLIFAIALSALFTHRIVHFPIQSDLFALLFVMLALILIRQLIKTEFEIHPRNYFFTVFVAVLAFVVMHLMVIAPLSNYLERSRPFITSFEQLPKKPHTVFFKIGPDGEDIKFIANADRNITPVFIQTEQALIQYKAPACFIAIKKDYEALPIQTKRLFSVLAQGKIGHKLCVLFSRRLRYSREGGTPSFPRRQYPVIPAKAVPRHSREGGNPVPRHSRESLEFSTPSFPRRRESSTPSFSRKLRIQYPVIPAKAGIQYLVILAKA